MSGHNNKRVLTAQNSINNNHYKAPKYKSKLMIALSTGLGFSALILSGCSDALANQPTQTSSSQKLLSQVA